MIDVSHIRNFSIIAHIDHGKSTLADRFLQLTHAVSDREFREQLLDSMDLERERGITIKCHPVRMTWNYQGKIYILNLIDTPGHVDFCYEVSRSLAACEGAILLIDATQGVQAQTVANVNLAMRLNLVIIPVINKIDLPAADIEMCMEQMEEILQIPSDEALLVSAKTGEGVEDLLKAVIKRIPPPQVQEDGTGRALIFDAFYDNYRGVVNYVRVFSGEFARGTQIKFMNNELTCELDEVGVFTPKMEPIEKLTAGMVGYLIPHVKSATETKIGDTITYKDRPAPQALPGFQEVKPMVFCGIYPVETADFESLRQNIAKLALNDSALVYQTESSAALGFGLRCGFLGLLHMEIVQERLRREYDMDIISTYPSVVYRVYLHNGEMLEIDNPLKLPEPTLIQRIEEPHVTASIISPSEYLGAILNLIREKRGVCEKTETVDHRHIMITASIPMHEIVIDFYDRLKTISKGYASLDYEFKGYFPEKLVRMDILINGEPVDAFAAIVPEELAYIRGRQLVSRLKEVIPRHLFQIPIQAAIGGKIIARETISALRKDVTAKCYGGDITRKRKLLEKQKEGKKKMKAIGKVHIPQEAFIAVLKNTES